MAQTHTPEDRGAMYLQMTVVLTSGVVVNTWNPRTQEVKIERPWGLDQSELYTKTLSPWMCVLSHAKPMHSILNTKQKTEKIVFDLDFLSRISAPPYTLQIGSGIL